MGGRRFFWRTLVVGAFCSATQPFEKSAERFYSSPCSETRRSNGAAVRPFAALARVPSRNAQLIGVEDLQKSGIKSLRLHQCGGRDHFEKRVRHKQAQAR